MYCECEYLATIMNTHIVTKILNAQTCMHVTMLWLSFAYSIFFTFHILQFTFYILHLHLHLQTCMHVTMLRLSFAYAIFLYFIFFLTASIFIERQRLEIGLEIFYFRFHILLFTFYILTFISYICICRAACMGQCCYSHLPMQSSPHLSFLLTSLTIPLTTG